MSTVSARHPDGRRRQIKRSYDTQGEAIAERGKDRLRATPADVSTPTKLTMDEYLDQWMDGKRRLRKKTREAHEDSLKPVRTKLGGVQLRKLTKTDLDKLVEWMLKEGRRVSNRRKKGLSVSTVVRTLKVLSQALDSAVLQGIVARNVVKLVEIEAPDQRETETWTPDDVQRFVAHVESDHLFPARLFSLYGMRRGEVMVSGRSAWTWTVRRHRSSVSRRAAGLSWQTARYRSTSSRPGWDTPRRASRTTSTCTPRPFYSCDFTT